MPFYLWRWWSVRFGVLGLCMEQQQIELEILFFLLQYPEDWLSLSLSLVF